MSVTLTVSDKAFQKLQISAKQQGKKNVEELLEEWQDESAIDFEKKLARRRELGERMSQLRERIFLEHGTMPDSTELIREDRER